ncbi:hypothetical protein DL89DRAFT_319429 [Linderina pennispora]|uniref:Uncharacterized protein n=1 Tax=Linderina pennispora TaxID=61395 RepID=A0A1Y1WJD0_9FUNG|nr:uncharacterized protein DL89DRAFT_319429 [Linderina pennispora]ORX73680.1 hypothetical protein DL89DRAFT_319429 [Linderina pennispora]
MAIWLFSVTARDIIGSYMTTVAPSFTGARLITYLAQNAPEDVKIAVGGRSEYKVEATQRRIIANNPELKDLGQRIREIVAQTRVVATTVGPYALRGSELVRACVEEKTDYCDITGEVPWVKKMHDELNDKAVRNKVHIASFCGFDSIPADIGCFMLAEYAKQKLDKPLLHVKGSITRVRGGVSGGTLATAIEQIGDFKTILSEKFLGSEESTDAEKTLRNPTFNRSMIHYDNHVKRWQTFWIMGEVNNRVAGWAGQVLNYGPRFTYSESMSAYNVIHAVLVPIGLAYFAFLMLFSFIRNLLFALSIIPRPGSGPSERATKKGHFTLSLEGFTDEGSAVYGKVVGTSDPGYGETIKYLGESALCLALDRDSSFKPGVYPPSIIMGNALLSRLRSRGCQFEVSNTPIEWSKRKKHTQ